MKIVFIVSLLFLFFACNQETKLSEKNNETTSTNLNEIKIDSLKLLRSKLDNITILSLKKGFMESSLPDSSICSSWILAQNDILEIIKTSKAIDSDDIHFLFETQSCVYTGEFELDGKRYIYGINSGGWIHMQFGNIVLGCFDSRCEKYYLGTVDDPKEEFNRNTSGENN